MFTWEIELFISFLNTLSGILVEMQLKSSGWFYMTITLTRKFPAMQALDVLTFKLVKQ